MYVHQLRVLQWRQQQYLVKSHKYHGAWCLFCWWPDFSPTPSGHEIMKLSTDQDAKMKMCWDTMIDWDSKNPIANPNLRKWKSPCEAKSAGCQIWCDQAKWWSIHSNLESCIKHHNNQGNYQDIWPKFCLIQSCCRVLDSYIPHHYRFRFWHNFHPSHATFDYEVEQKPFCLFVRTRRSPKPKL